MKKQNLIHSGFKSQCISINEQISKLEVYLHSRKNKSKTFAPLQKEFLAPSKKITLKSNHFIFPMKNKDICDYNPRCIMSSGLMFDDIIIDHMKRMVSSHTHTAENDCVFTQIVYHISYIYRGSLQKLYWKKGTYECIEMLCEHYCLKKNEVKDYRACVLKNDTTIYEMDELVDHCLVSFEKLHKQYIIMPSLSLDPLLIEESSFVTV